MHFGSGSCLVLTPNHSSSMSCRSLTTTFISSSVDYVFCYLSTGYTITSTPPSNCAVMKSVNAYMEISPYFPHHFPDSYLSLLYTGKNLTIVRLLPTKNCFLLASTLKNNMHRIGYQRCTPQQCCRLDRRWMNNSHERYRSPVGLSKAHIVAIVKFHRLSPPSRSIF